MAERTDLGLDALAELLQPATHDLVVIAAAGVARDVGLRRLSQLALDGPWNIRQVIHATGKHPHGAGHKIRRLRAKRGMTRHIIHLAVPSHSKPLGEPAAGRGQVYVRNADRLEAEFGAPEFDLMRLDPFRERGHDRAS